MLASIGAIYLYKRIEQVTSFWEVDLGARVRDSMMIGCDKLLSILGEIVTVPFSVNLPAFPIRLSRIYKKLS